MEPRRRSIVVGCLLGDAYVYPNGTLQIEHAEGQRAYVEWKFRQFASVAGKAPRRVERFDPRYGKTYRSLRFYTRAVFRAEREAFYSEGRKTVPERIASWLDPLALAVWFMDDGGRGGRTPKGIVWNVASFRPAERERLQNALRDRYEIETTIQRTGRGTLLYVRAVSAERFHEVVSPHVIPSMRYKLPLDPVTTEAKAEAVVVR